VGNFGQTYRLKVIQPHRPRLVLVEPFGAGGISPLFRFWTQKQTEAWNFTWMTVVGLNLELLLEGTHTRVAGFM
jgi:hypothetical protein